MSELGHMLKRAQEMAARLKESWGYMETLRVNFSHNFANAILELKEASLALSDGVNLLRENAADETEKKLALRLSEQLEYGNDLGFVSLFSQERGKILNPYIAKYIESSMMEMIMAREKADGLLNELAEEQRLLISEKISAIIEDGRVVTSPSVLMEIDERTIQRHIEESLAPREPENSPDDARVYSLFNGVKR